MRANSKDKKSAKVVETTAVVESPAEKKKSLPVPQAELAVTTGSNPEGLIELAIREKLPVENLERLLEMRSKYRAEIAEEEFDNSMAAFQGECPVIKKTKAGGKTKNGDVVYYYAPLESIVEQVRDLLKKHGFSYSMQTETLDSEVVVTCLVKHICGHKQGSTVRIPFGDRTAVMSATQVVAATLTFGKRLSFCNAFGILTGDDDMDGRKLTTDEQQHESAPPASHTQPAAQAQQPSKKFTSLAPAQIQKNTDLFASVCRVVPFTPKLRADLEAAAKEHLPTDYQGILRNKMNAYFEYQTKTKKIFNDEKVIKEILRELKVTAFDFLDMTNAIIALEALNDQFLKKAPPIDAGPDQPDNVVQMNGAQPPQVNR